MHFIYNRYFFIYLIIIDICNAIFLFCFTVCKENEYDCEDATCIAAELECNGKINCRFKWDEDEKKCNVSFNFVKI